MMRRTGTLAVLGLVISVAAGCVPLRGASPLAPGARAALTEATRLDAVVERLYRGGRFRDAVPLAARSLALRSQAIEPGDPELAISLTRLALLCDALGNYAQAEPLYRRALAIREQALGPMDGNVASSLGNLATLYMSQGAHAKAEPLLVRSLAIRERTNGPMDRAVADCLNNLAALYDEQHAYAKAEPLYLRALAIREHALGSMHRDVAQSLDNLASLYDEQAMYAKAEPLQIRSLAIRERVLGPRHPGVAISLNNLALHYQMQGAYTKAEPLYLRALAIDERALGPDHPQLAIQLDNLAALYWAQGAYAKAASAVARAVEIQEHRLRLELAGLSEPRKRALMVQLQGETESVVSLHADEMPSSPRALELALTTVLRRKGRVLDSLIDNHAELRAHLTPALRGTLDQLAAARTELSTRLGAPPDPRDAATGAAAIAILRARVDDLESRLNAASSERLVQAQPITIASIQASLPPGAALVEFVGYHRYPRAGEYRREARYVAYVLPWQGAPQAVALGEAAPIDAGIDAVLAAMHRGTSAAAAQAALQHLDRLVFDPLRGPLANVTHVLLSPDGKLNLVPFEALVDPRGHYELEDQLISYVSSGRDLPRLATRYAPRSPAAVVAAPDYGPPRSPAFGGLHRFRPLDGALAELTTFTAYAAAARTLTGKNATKAALAALAGPAVLHIATHGFYAPSQAQEASRGIVVEGPPPPADSEDPLDALDRAGLAMAGANDGPEGIATARELASYDWWGTQLVVLSACETGVGAAPSGDGVYGMRRALVLSGAEAQVVSLWSVSDASTPELMRAFYGELARGTGRAEALRAAKRSLLRQPSFAHPYYWAAFVSAGDWAPLSPYTLDPPGDRR